MNSVVLLIPWKVPKQIRLFDIRVVCPKTRYIEPLVYTHKPRFAMRSVHGAIGSFCARHIVSYSFDLSTERSQPLLNSLVATIDLANIIDDAASLRAERRDQQRHAGADIWAWQALRLAI